ncbi:unnamed protein product [Rotaria magnacalcarata]|uniref:Uncharacterized protein n=1 Tax=Rotaria magnacalcarata TaxID=392030 RepID=A0A8S2T0V5_9BILA|nr:unnamed protein product [Rotaria magnacalcarata]
MEIPELNGDIGLHLFLSIATVSDRMFVEIMKKFRGSERILLPAKIYGNYLQDCEILDDKLVPFENDNPSIIQPVQRLFVHPCVNIEGFGAL